MQSRTIIFILNTVQYNYNYNTIRVPEKCSKREIFLKVIVGEDMLD